VVANPLAAAGVLGGAAYLALRIPTAIFYARLGTTPDDVGLGPQVLVPQSLVLLVVILFAMAAGTVGVYLVSDSRTMLSFAVAGRFANDRRWLHSLGAAVIPVVVGSVVAVGGAEAAVAVVSDLPAWLSWLIALVLFVAATRISATAVLLIPGAASARRELYAQRRRRRDWWERRRAFLNGVLSIALTALVLLSVIAYAGGTSVVHGGDAQGKLFPWRAIPAEVDWKSTAAKARFTNRCGELRLLGSTSNQVVLYDTRLDRAFRVPLNDVSVSTAIDCLWVKVQALVGDKQCSAGHCKWDVRLRIESSDPDARVSALTRRRCRNGRCTYRPQATITRDVVRLPAGRNHLRVKATDGDRTAQQVVDIVVP
jgi:hypothetical protein